MSSPYLGKPSICLTGFMFTGKSNVGRTLAGRLGLNFIDLDEEITSLAKASIEKIFAEHGEKEFRRLEREAVANVLPVPGQVIATGGGVVIDPLNRKLLRRHSCVIWLKASMKTILNRLLAEREPFYRECDFSVETDGLSVGKVSQIILEKLSQPESNTDL
jgi:shikimate kinase